MTSEIKNFIPWDLKSECPDIIDETTRLRRPQKLGDCQTDVILSHFSNRSEHNSSYMKFKSHFLKEAKANIERIGVPYVRSMLIKHVKRDLDRRDSSPGVGLINKLDCHIGRVFNKVHDEMNEIAWKNRGENETSTLKKEYYALLDKHRNETIEELEKLPDRAIEAFKQATLSTIETRIEQNEQRIADKKEKTTLYQDPKKAKVVFQGSQYNSDRSNTYVNKDYIQYLTKRDVPGAKFGDEKVATRVSDGTCTAMSLTLAKQFKEIKRTLKSSGVQASPDRTQQAINKIASDLKYRVSPAKCIATQALFNTLELTDEEGVDPKRAKMELMANVMGITIIDAKDEIDMNSADATQNLAKTIEGLEDGTYALRMINTDESKMKVSLRCRRVDSYF